MTWTWRIQERTLHFKEPAGTSRGVYLERKVWYVLLQDENGHYGVGECAPLPDLSCDSDPEYGQKLAQVCALFVQNKSLADSVPLNAPSMRFGLETALAHMQAQSVRFFNTPFSRGEVSIPINGLVWMGQYAEMLRRLEAKLQAGFHCVKLKIGAIDFEQECALLRYIRERFTPNDLEIRLDANGAFSAHDVFAKLERLAAYTPHSIEQPIKQGQWELLAKVCQESPIDIALDEELIGLHTRQQKQELLTFVKPKWLVLKPSLHGGMQGSAEWKELANEHGIGSWVTSALESNIGLNAIAQWCAKYPLSLPQGLGTGQLFTDNIQGLPITLNGCAVSCDPNMPTTDLRTLFQS